MTPTKSRLWNTLHDKGLGFINRYVARVQRVGSKPRDERKLKNVSHLHCVDFGSYFKQTIKIK